MLMKEKQWRTWCKLGALPQNEYKMCEKIVNSNPVSVLDVLAGDGERLNFIRGRSKQEVILYAMETDAQKLITLGQRSIPFAYEGVGYLPNYRNFDVSITSRQDAFDNDEDIIQFQRTAKTVYFITNNDVTFKEKLKSLGFKESEFDNIFVYERTK